MSKKSPTFEEALQQLESITQEIEQGKIGLEDSISKYEEGMKLVQYCRSVLERAEQKIEQLQRAADGSLKVTPFEPPAAEPSPSTSSGHESI